MEALVSTEQQPPVATAPMTEEEARACTDEIRRHLNGARKELLDLHDREGWRALGYPSWRECVVQEFGLSQAYLYRELKAAQIERELSPNGEVGAIPESHLRPLAPLTPEQRQQAWEEANAGEQPRTAAVVEEAAARVTGKPPKSDTEARRVCRECGGVNEPGKRQIIDWREPDLCEGCAKNAEPAAAPEPSPAPAPAGARPVPQEPPAPAPARPEPTPPPAPPAAERAPAPAPHVPATRMYALPEPEADWLAESGMTLTEAVQVARQVSEIAAQKGRSVDWLLRLCARPALK